MTFLSELGSSLDRLDLPGAFSLSPEWLTSLRSAQRKNKLSPRSGPGRANCGLSHTQGPTRATALERRPARTTDTPVDRQLGVCTSGFSVYSPD